MAAKDIYNPSKSPFGKGDFWVVYSIHYVRLWLAKDIYNPSKSPFDKGDFWVVYSIHYVSFVACQQYLPTDHNNHRLLYESVR